MILTIMTQGNPGDTLLTPWEQALHYFVLDLITALHQVVNLQGPKATSQHSLLLH